MGNNNLEQLQEEARLHGLKCHDCGTSKIVGFARDTESIGCMDGWKRHRAFKPDRVKHFCKDHPLEPKTVHTPVILTKRQARKWQNYEAIN